MVREDETEFDAGISSALLPFRLGQTLQWVDQPFQYVGPSSSQPDCSIVERRTQLFYVLTSVLIEQNLKTV